MSDDDPQVDALRSVRVTAAPSRMSLLQPEAPTVGTVTDPTTVPTVLDVGDPPGVAAPAVTTAVGPAGWGLPVLGGFPGSGNRFADVPFVDLIVRNRIGGPDVADEETTAGTGRADRPRRGGESPDPTTPSLSVPRDWGDKQGATREQGATQDHAAPERPSGTEEPSAPEGLPSPHEQSAPVELSGPRESSAAGESRARQGSTATPGESSQPQRSTAVPRRRGEGTSIAGHRSLPVALTGPDSDETPPRRSWSRPAFRYRQPATRPDTPVREDRVPQTDDSDVPRAADEASRVVSLSDRESNDRGVSTADRESEGVTGSVPDGDSPAVSSPGRESATHYDRAGGNQPVSTPGRGVAGGPGLEVRGEATGAPGPTPRSTLSAQRLDPGPTAVSTPIRPGGEAPRAGGISPGGQLTYRRSTELTAGERDWADTTAGERDWADTTAGERDWADTTAGERDWADTTAGERDWADTTAGERDWADTTAGERDRAGTTAGERDRASTTGQAGTAERNRVDPTAQSTPELSADTTVQRSPGGTATDRPGDVPAGQSGEQPTVGDRIRQPAVEAGTDRVPTPERPDRRTVPPPVAFTYLSRSGAPETGVTGETSAGETQPAGRDATAGVTDRGRPERSPGSRYRPKTGERVDRGPAARGDDVDAGTGMPVAASQPQEETPVGERMGPDRSARTTGQRVARTVAGSLDYLSAPGESAAGSGPPDSQAPAAATRPGRAVIDEASTPAGSGPGASGTDLPVPPLTTALQSTRGRREPRQSTREPREPAGEASSPDRNRRDDVAARGPSGTPRLQPVRSLRLRTRRESGGDAAASAAGYRQTTTSPAGETSVGRTDAGAESPVGRTDAGAEAPGGGIEPTSGGIEPVSVRPEPTRPPVGSRGPEGTPDRQDGAGSRAVSRTVAPRLPVSEPARTGLRGESLMQTESSDRTVRSGGTTEMPSLTLQAAETGEVGSSSQEQPGPSPSEPEPQRERTERPQGGSGSGVADSTGSTGSDLPERTTSRRGGQSQTGRGRAPPEGRETATLYPDLTVKTLAPRIDVTRREEPEREVTHRSREQGRGGGSGGPDVDEFLPGSGMDAGPSNAEMDRLVEKLHREIERKMRIERERRGL